MLLMNDGRYAWWERQAHPSEAPAMWTKHRFPDGSSICMHCGQIAPCREERIKTHDTRAN